MTGGAPTFTQVGSKPLYAASSGGDSGVTGYWVGYRSAGALGTTPTLDQLWQDVGGVYLFLEATPANLAAFSDSLEAMLPRIAPAGGLRALWIVNPLDDPGSWRFHTLFATATGSGPSIAWSVRRTATFILGRYALMAAAGAAMTQASPALGFGIAFDAASISFLAPGGGYTAATGSAAIPLSGPSVGAWVATISVSNGSQEGMAQLGVALRYAIPAHDGRGDAAVRVIEMPIVQQLASAVTLYVSFDPLNPLISARSQLGFFDPGGSGTPAALASAFVTAQGRRTTLTPLAGATPLGPGRLAFNATPIFVTPDPTNAYLDYYLSPDGAFTIAVAPAAAERPPDPTLVRLVFGTSGLEYAGLPPSGNSVAWFAAGQPAFAPNAVSGRPVPPDAQRLTSLATTSYVTFVPPTTGTPGYPYYAQPRQSPLFTYGTDLGSGFLDFAEIPATTLPTLAQGSPAPPALPVGVYSRIDPKLAAAARLLEEVAIAPARHAALGLPPTRVALADDVPLAVTPLGMVATLSADESRLTGVVIGNLPDASVPLLSFTSLGPAFQAAVLANQVFFVVRNVDVLMASGSVQYRLDPARLALLPSRGVPANVVDALNTLLGGLNPPYPVFQTESAFTTTIDPVAHDYIPRILPVAGLLLADLQGWKFQLSPRSWRSGLDTPTLLLFKFCPRSLADMVADTGTWAWPEAARDGSRKLGPTQAIIQKLFAAAERAAAGTPYRRFYDQVVNNPAWNGVLFLNAPVSLSELPSELQFVTAGIDANEFYAHHVGFSLTPFEVTQTAIQLRQTAVFALIDYQDPYDLFLSSNIPFAFKTLALRARFANALLVDFAAQVELMMNRLFGAELTKRPATRGNNLVLDGSFQRRPGQLPSYSFALRDENRYDVAHSALDQLEVLGVQLQTSTGTDTAHTVRTDFILSGNLRFVELTPFDLFSYGAERWAPAGTPAEDAWLRYGNLVVRMSFPLATPAQQTFQAFEGERMSFDLSNSKTRTRSLAHNFPLQLTGCVAGASKPEDLGYVSVFTQGVDQVPLSPPWFGVTFAVDLGTLGALAGSVGLSLGLLAAWAPGVADGDLPVYVGLKFPSGDPLSAILPIQGVVHLGFRSFQFQSHDDDPANRKRSYMLRMRRFALSILGWSFPPGNADVFLFGNPDGSGRASLGWYGAYVPDPKKKQSPRSDARRSRSGRRGTPPRGGA